MTHLELIVLIVNAVLLAGLLRYQLRTRYFYFIRHGETLLNKELIKQGSEGGLSELGKEQATRVRASMETKRITNIISSPYPRAKETTAIINETMRRPVHLSLLLAERRNASSVIGRPVDDPEVRRIMGRTDRGYHADDYRYEDEENFADLALRARKCLSFLEWSAGSRICVVTHHAFLQILIAFMLYRKRLHAEEFTKLSYFNYSDNGGITTCRYSPWKLFSPTRGWEVLSYNEEPK